MELTQEQIDKLEYTYQKEKAREKLEQEVMERRNREMLSVVKDMLAITEEKEKKKQSLFEDSERKKLFNETRYSRKVIIPQDYFGRAILETGRDITPIRDITPKVEPAQVPALTTPEEKALIKDSKFLQKFHKLRSLQKNKREYTKLTRKKDK